MSIQRVAALLLLFSVAASVASVQKTETIAFPGAEGYGLQFSEVNDIVMRYI